MKFSKALPCLSAVLLVPLFAIFAVSTAAGQGITICPSGMIDYWQLDEATPAYESLLSGRDANCTNCPDPISGIVGGAQRFDGDDEADVAADPAYDWGAGDDFTVEFWIRSDYVCDDDDNLYNGIVAGRYDGGTGDNLKLWWIGLNCATSGAQYDQGVIRFVLKDDSTNPPVAYGSTVVTDGDWHHVAVIRNGSTNENIIYVDGGQDGVVAAGPYTDGFASDVDLTIGYLDFDTGFNLKADVDELAIYDVALSDTEILEHFNRGNTEGKGFCKETPQITSVPIESVNLGDSYSYDVDATGDPDPTFSLLVSPAGMTINSTTGLISWNPTAAGNYNVTVEAANEVGTDEQPFVVSVEYVEPPPCPDGMTHYWKLDETSGPLYDDLWGANDAECLSGTCPAGAAGIISGAQYFDGVDDEVVIPDDESFDWGPDDNFSIEFWMKKGSECAGTTSPANDVIIGRYNSTVGHLNVMWVGINCAVSDGTQGALRFVLKDKASNGPVLVTDESYVDDVWHHVVAIRDADLDSLYLYVDGSKERSAYWDYTGGFDDSTHLAVGYLPLTGFFRYEGYLDELALYDKVLLENEIQAHYQIGLLGYGYCDEMEFAPEIVSTPVTQATVGQLYQYDVDATGFPGPEYTIVSGPLDMTISTSSGLIQWIPSIPDDYEVTVSATNTAGQDEQTFTVSVSDALPCPSALQHYWQLEETCTPHCDIVGAAEATLSGGSPSQVIGQVGFAQQFVRSESDGLDVTSSTSFDWDFNSSFSIAFWLKKVSDCDSDDNDGNNIVVGRYDGNPGDGDLNIFWVGVNCRSAEGTQGGIRFVLRDDAGAGHSFVSGNSVIDGEWHYVVAVRDGALNESSIYIDGELDGSISYTASGGFSDDSPVNIGYIDFGAKFCLDGYLDELAVYDRVLGVDEMAIEYYSGLKGLNYCNICGDTDFNGYVDIDDVVYLIAYIFGGGPAPVNTETGDLDCSDEIDIDDVVYGVAYIFGGGPLPCFNCLIE